MTIRFLINDNGSPFDSSEIQILRNTLDSLVNCKREEYRDQNALAISGHDAVKFLIVSGPGTGKSRLFLKKIDHWYQKDKDASVVVTSFVRKLVADLQNDIERDEKLTDEQKGKITVSTLHRYARSIVEKNHGTTEWSFKPHFRIIGQSWKEIVWGDVLAFFPDTDRSVYTWKELEMQLHDNKYESSDEWKELKKNYFKLCQFYNAAGFADLILRATMALAEKPTLNDNNYFIVDEYMDFNLSEAALIDQLATKAKGLLIVGDDEQVLYNELKSGKPTLIRNLYKNVDYANGMLPFCGRSSYFITKSADYFIRQNKETENIEKIFLPLKNNNNDPKVQIIACATSSTAVDYIERFVADNITEIDERKRQLESGEAKDAFLLILTPAREVNFYGQSKDKIKSIAAKYQTKARSFSEDYYKLLSYYSLANNPHNNFTFRKVLYYEGVSEEKVHELILACLKNNKYFCDLGEKEVKNALTKCKDVKTILDGREALIEKLDRISGFISIADRKRLQYDIECKSISEGDVAALEHEEEEEAELEEIEVKRMGAVELITIVGSKGLSADHVIIIGFDNVNMKRITKNAFYVAMTRARKSLHIITALKSGGAKKAHDFLDQLSDEYAECFSYKKTGRTKDKLSGKQEFKKYLDTLSSMSRQRRQV